MNIRQKWIRNSLGTSRRWLLRLSALAFAFQLLVPAGFMPTAIASGSLVALCDSYLPPTVHPASHSMGTHVDGEHDEHSNSEAWENCPLGALSGAAAPVNNQDLDLATYRDDYDFSTTRALTSSTTVTGYRSRAPPFVSELNLII